MILPLNGKTPEVASSAYIAPTATLIGEVVIEEDVSIWFGQSCAAPPAEKLLCAAARMCRTTRWCILKKIISEE